jgi:hypothetical protein
MSIALLTDEEARIREEIVELRNAAWDSGQHVGLADRAADSLLALLACVKLMESLCAGGADHPLNIAVANGCRSENEGSLGSAGGTTGGNGVPARSPTKSESV